MMRPVYFLSALFLSVLVTCNRVGSEKAQESYFKQDTVRMMNEAGEVIYALSLPTDIAVLLDKSGLNYMPQLLASTENASRYQDTNQLAVIMGIYGVDLSYAKIYNQAAAVQDYYSMLKILSGRLDVPEKIFTRSKETLESSFNNPDSLTAAIRRIYSDTDHFFLSTGNEHLATLSLMGGWVEAMYIGVNLYELSENKEMRERILQQKYSLNSLISLLSNYQDDPQLTAYLLMLKKLRNLFAGVEIRYVKEGFAVDTANHTLQSSGVVIHYDPTTVDHICRVVMQIRNELIN